MSRVIDLAAYRAQQKTGSAEDRRGRKRAPSKLLDAQNIERLTLQIDHVLEEKARRECRPDAVAMAAGRYAAIQLFRTHGRAQAQAFFEDCLQTAEICDDILAQLDDDFV